jgi:uncharacterized membrane protein
MKNQQSGYLIVGGGLIIGYIFYIFHKSIKDIVSVTCDNELECNSLISTGNITLIYIIIIIIILYGLYIILFGKEGYFKIEKKEEESLIPSKDYITIMENLSEDENKILQKIIDAQGSIYQSELVKWSEFNKVKITRILDKLEGKNLIERKRRGMTNIVILKH